MELAEDSQTEFRLPFGFQGASLPPQPVCICARPAASRGNHLLATLTKIK